MNVRQAAEILGRLFAAFPDRDQGEDARASRVASYLMAIEGVSRAALLEAERRIVRGEAGNDPRFVPTPAELAGLCRRIDVEMRTAGLPRLPPPDLSAFDKPADPAMVRKFDALLGQMARTAHAHSHETPREWRERMIADGRLTPPPEIETEAAP